MPLTRAKTMPTQRSATDKRMAAVASKAKASRSAGAAAKRQKAVAAKATKATYQAAVKAVLDMKEEKYFNCVADQQIYPEVPTAGSKKCSVAAFATTSNLDPQGNILTYCGRNIYKLDMLKPFKSTDTPIRAPNKLDGKYCIPTSSLIGWNINRNYVEMEPIQSSTTDPNSVHGLPVRCRVIRVTPKLAAGVTAQINPSQDLFLDQYGEPYSALFNSFTYSDLEYAQVNTNVYTVLGDDKFTLVPPLNVTNTDNSGLTYWRPSILAYPTGANTKRMVTSHQLADKKGGAVHYNQPDAAATVNATSGSRREYIFMHFWYQSGDHGNQAALTGAGIVPAFDDIKIHLRPESRFKDA